MFLARQVNDDRQPSLQIVRLIACTNNLEAIEIGYRGQTTDPKVVTMPEFPVTIDRNTQLRLVANQEY